MNSEVLIVGAGVIGLSIARSLRKKGVKKITILERGKIGREASFAAAGMLAPNAENQKLDDFYRFCAASNELYTNFAAALFAETGIDIELENTGTLYLAFSATDEIEAEHRFQRLTKAGVAIEKLTAADIRRAEPFVSPEVRGGLFFAADRQVENRRLLAALTAFAAENDIKIIENTPVESLTIECARAVAVQTRSKNFAADSVIFATGAWTSLIKTGGFTLPEIKPIRGQMIAFKSLRRSFFHVLYTPRGYLVPRLDGRIVAGATVENAGFDKSVSDAGIEFVRENALEIAPGLEKITVSEKWVGLRPMAADGLPVLGSFPPVENFFIATAHYRNGILLAPLTGEIIAQKICGESASEFLEIFSPSRFKSEIAAIT